MWKGNTTIRHTKCKLTRGAHEHQAGYLPAIRPSLKYPQGKPTKTSSAGRWDLPEISTSTTVWSATHAWRGHRHSGAVSPNGGEKICMYLHKIKSQQSFLLVCFVSALKITTKDAKNLQHIIFRISLYFEGDQICSRRFYPHLSSLSALGHTWLTSAGCSAPALEPRSTSGSLQMAPEINYHCSSSPSQWHRLHPFQLLAQMCDPMSSLCSYFPLFSVPYFIFLLFSALPLLLSHSCSPPLAAGWKARWPRHADPHSHLQQTAGLSQGGIFKVMLLWLQLCITCINYATILLGSYPFIMYH